MFCRQVFGNILADFAVFRVFGGISRDFAEMPEFRGSATARNIRSPVLSLLFLVLKLLSKRKKYVMWSTSVQISINTMKGLYFTCTWLTFWIKITPRFCNCVITWIKSVIEHTSVLFCVVKHSPDYIFNVDRCNIQWCQGLGNEIITTYHHIFVIPSHYTDPDHQSDSVLYTLYTRTGLKFTTLLSHRRPNADIAPGKSIVPKTHFGYKNP